MSAASEEALGELHSALATALSNAIKSNDCAASIMAVAAKFLKDNNITCTPGTDNALVALEEALSRRQNARKGSALTPEEKAQLGPVADTMRLMQ